MQQDTRSPGGRIDAVLIAAGEWHDIDFARLELLKLLAEDDRVRVRVFEDYENIEAIEAADFLITYTCNVTPTEHTQQRLRAWVQGGGRWYALHGTNSIIRMMASGREFETPDLAPVFMQTLGSMFKSHPPIAPYTVEVADPSHWLVHGIEPFESTDELYLMHTYGELHVLLDAPFAGDTPGFSERHWPAARHPVFYLRTLGQGAVLYLTLGHCRHHYDMQPMMQWWPTVERCAWDTPQYYELLRRGLRWAIEPIDELTRDARARMEQKYASRSG